jgi:hypothetical protein
VGCPWWRSFHSLLEICGFRSSPGVAFYGFFKREVLRTELRLKKDLVNAICPFVVRSSYGPRDRRTTLTYEVLLLLGDCAMRFS